jgi:hypothetical protein
MWLTIARRELAPEARAAETCAGGGGGNSAATSPQPSPPDTTAPAQHVSAEHDAAISAACLLIRAGHPGAAADLLAKAAKGSLLIEQDAAALNLFGVSAERQGRWDEAQHYYRRAARLTGPGAAAARHNQRRYYELFTFGRCRDKAALGDCNDVPLSEPDRSLQRRLTRMLRGWWFP